ncbi:MAG TPA: ABC transporter permease [Bryobacteraceae bacterium]|nr:ABC transporter permease [Bryobacteraceae bacterium]
MFLKTWIHSFSDLRQDLAYAARMLRKAPAFAATAVVTIALGIAASTAIFSVTDAILLRPLPYKNPGRLVLASDFFSNARFFDLRNATSGVFEDTSSIMVFRAIVPREDGTAERINKGLVSTSFLSMLGAHVVFGRDFTDADGKPHGVTPPPFPPPEGSVAILSYEYFQRRYGADRSVLGRHMMGANGTGPEIVGVVEPGFKLILPDRPNPEVWIANDRGYDAPNRDALMLQVVAHLRHGVTPDTARAYTRVGLWQSTLVNEVRPAILAIFGAVIFLLLIACANVANLLLVRVSLRDHEIAVRSALGARAGRLTRQLLAEAVLLCGLGTSFGVALAWIAVREILVLAPADLPRLQSASIDWRVLAFSALAGLVESAVLGLLPAWRAIRSGIMDVIRGSERSSQRPSGGLLRSAVIVGEVALSFVLLIGSGLMVRSFLELRRVNPGYDPHGLLTFLPVGDAHDFQRPQRRIGFLLALEDRLRAIPGVQSVGAATGLPLHTAGSAIGIQWGTDRIPADPFRNADLPTVLPGYFETLRSRVVEGRTFSEVDNLEQRPLAVIDQQLAAKAFPNQSAIGKRLFVRVPDPQWLEIIGVVEHQRLGSLVDPGRDQIFMSDGCWGIGISRHWALRTNGDPENLAPLVRDAIARFAPGRLAITEMQTMDTTVQQAQTATRFQLLLIAIFAAISALLAAVGLYGVLASAVRQRTPEIGVRMALGATPATIFKLVIGRGLALSSAGIVVGIVAAAVLTRAISSMLVGVKPTDPATFAAIAVLFLLIAALSSWVPAHRAAALDPITALRDE